MVSSPASAAVFFAARLAVLAATMSAVLMLMWSGVHEPYISQATRSTDIVLFEAKRVVEGADARIAALDENVAGLTVKCDQVRARLRDVLDSYVTIQQRLDAIDSRLYRIDRLAFSSDSSPE